MLISVLLSHTNKHTHTRTPNTHTEESARFRLGRMHEKLTQLERKMVNVEARLSLGGDAPLADSASVMR